MKEVTCVLCGVRPASTGQGDHIPPRGLYTKSERRSAKYQFHTVPACIQCNTGDSKHDENLKILIGIESGSEREDKADVIDALAKTVGNNQRIADQIFNTAKRSTEGRTIGVKVTFDANSYRKSISRIAKAMYWRMTEEILPSSAKIETYSISEIASDAADNLRAFFVHLPTMEINGGTFKCKLMKQGNSSVLMINFFDCHTAIAFIET
ncbi:MAG: hypothetical protein VYE17_05795 [Pseudomonadota bacterium]|nr:hypothetical protein [Pseudomonadota bacterium]